MSDGHDMDHYAADAAAVVEHSTCATRSTSAIRPAAARRRATSRAHGKGRVAKLVLDRRRAAADGEDRKPIRAACRSRCSTACAGTRGQPRAILPRRRERPVLRLQPAGREVSQGVIDNWWRQGMMGSAKAHYDGIKAFSETDFTEDLKNIDVPTLVMHGDDDQIVPIADSAPLSARLLARSTLKIYDGLPHGLCTTHPDIVNADLLAFFHA